ncbi:Nucleotide-binding universal stress protein, UspA family [Actinacidiphila yanglinensis]|uniref:Nucleotide-binding universal stress protein, UspA family n=1 Tax=Actinacidiphila yanglinensis TaxID=310779 RepID=A0A1H6DE21_9ACTN|nr:universal stress protein [Actinacidiphila yanglinensis]SEG83500.1 Nucleotide-binding universal stress protein, UspA family [Actinacidiphila yanglinensis]
MAEGGRVILGISGSLRGLAALHRAVDEARRRDAELTAVLAWTPVGGEVAYRRYPCPPLLRECESAAAARLQQAFLDAFGGCPEGVRVQLATARGEPGAALTVLADRPDDLLVVGTGRQGAFRRLLHGGVSRYCLAHARCPVLAVPPSELMRDLDRTTRILGERPLKRPARHVADLASRRRAVG